MKPHIGSQVIFVGSIFPMKEIDERINEFFCTAERSKQLHDPHRAPTNLCNWETKSFILSEISEAQPWDIIKINMYFIKDDYCFML